ncbi:MAG TPA: elongation factor 4 [Clostridiales bacterium]|jgi:GTP-binding protein LepA|nr:elongation factor 4 [Clostridiales bacterium]
MTERQKYIRNFSIIAHIDHGKSTLADRILEYTRAVPTREMEEQLLDNMDLERERGITIKARAVSVHYDAEDGSTYSFNLIDTPGHVDFNYEVNRSLNACEGALLIVDATQGIEAQTLANAYLAVDAGLEIVPVINKIDLLAADVEGTRKEIEDIIGIPAEGCPAISAKNGINIESVLRAVVDHVPPPDGDEEGPLRALIFDSHYDSYRGVIVYIRVKTGSVKEGDFIRMMNSGEEFEVLEVGVMAPFGLRKTDILLAGDVGYLTAQIKDIGDTRVGDTVTGVENPAPEPLPGFKEARPMVYSGIYPADGARYGDLKDALEKLQLNDAALHYEPENSNALGFGFRCGFLGLLHMEIIQQRLEREFNLDLITTAPSVIYKLKMRDGRELSVDNPADYPEADLIEEAEEPIVKASIITPSDYMGTLMDICKERRGSYINMTYIDPKRVELHYEMPLNEIIYDFFDTLKSHSKGYASLDYELLEYRPSELAKLEILLNGENVDALSFIVHKDKAYTRARRICEKLRDNIPRTLFEIPVQAAVGGRIIARETVRALRKDVLAKCYGGDITRKKKLLEKQKEGKKRMRKLGSVEVSPEAFIAVLKIDDDSDKQ